MNLYRFIRAFFLSIILYFVLLTTSYSEIVFPNKEITSYDVIKIQLAALQNNNKPYKDAGIEQTWNFAHPRNKKMTGPFPRFKEMLYDKNYIILINHLSHQIKIVEQKENMHIFAVSIISNDSKNYVYIWIVQRAQHGVLKDCWLTTSVSFPEYDGDSI